MDEIVIENDIEEVGGTNCQNGVKKLSANWGI